MIPIGETHFHLASEPVSDKALQQYAEHLFQELDIASSRKLPFDDFALYLYVEQGSVKGTTQILIAASALYIGIGQFGSFVGGVREIASIVKTINDKVISMASEKAGVPPSSITWRKSDAGRLTKLQKLFDSVKQGNMEPTEAASRALELLNDEEPLPPESVRHIQEAIAQIEQDPQQIPLWEREVLPLDIPTPTKPPTRQPRSDSKVAIGPPPSKIGVEVKREHKDGKTTVKIIPI